MKHHCCHRSLWRCSCLFIVVVLFTSFSYIPIVQADHRIGEKEVSILKNFTLTDPVTGIMPEYTWHTLYGGNNGHDVATSTVTDASGNIFVTGSGCGNWQGVTPLHPTNCEWWEWNHLYVVKFNSSGVYQWHTYYGSLNGTSGSKILLDSSGNIYVIGTSSGTWPELSSRRPYSGSADIMILKLDPQGAYLWHTFYGGAGYESVTDAVIDSTGNIYLTGYGDGDWGNLIPLHPSSNSTSLYLLKVDRQGAYQWHTFYGSMSGFVIANDLKVDAAGNFLLSGTCFGSLDGLTARHAFVSGSHNLFLLKLNSDGAYLWHTYYAPGIAFVGGSLTDSTGNIYITGSSDEDWNGFSPLHPHSGDRDLFVLKLNQEGDYQWHTFYADGQGMDLFIDQIHNELLVIGAASDWVDLGSVNSHSGYKDLLLLKLDLSGNYLRHVYFGSSGYEQGNDLDIDGSGNMIIAGYAEYQNNGSWNGHLPIHGPSGNSAELFVMKVALREITAYDSSTTVSASKSAIGVGETITISATVSSEGGIPEGTVRFYEGDHTFGIAQLVNGVAELQTYFLVPGQTTVSANYRGSLNFLQSSGTMTSYVNVTKAESITYLNMPKTSSLFGEIVHLIASVSSVEDNIYVPDGRVFFKDGDNVIGSAQLLGGTGSIERNQFSVGEHMIQAEYEEGNTFLPSASANKLLIVSKSPVDKMISFSRGAIVPYGKPFSIHASINSSVNPLMKPDGTVIFKNGEQELETLPLVEGAADFEILLVDIGTHTFSVEYSGSNSYLPGTPVSENVTVTKGIVIPYISSDTGQELIVGSGSVFTIIIEKPYPNANTPTGTVTLRDGDRVLETIPLVDGIASSSKYFLNEGQHSITVTYNGDDYYFSVSSNPYLILIKKPMIFLPALYREE